MHSKDRRSFIKNTAVAGIGLGLAGRRYGFTGNVKMAGKGKRVGMVGVDTGIIPVPIKETLEIFAFMQAAEESKHKGGISVDIESVVNKAKRA